MRVAWLCYALIPWVRAAGLGETGPIPTDNHSSPESVLKPLLKGKGVLGDERNATLILSDGSKPLHRHRRAALCDSPKMPLTGREEIGRYSEDYHYDSNQTCTWVVTTPRSGDRIILISRDFLLEPSYKCRFDYVEIFDGNAVPANSIGKLCGRKTVRMISNSKKMTIKFKSDSSVEAPGFLFELTLLRAPSSSSPTCNTTIKSNTGTIQSPGYGPNSHYPDNTTCLYSFKAPRGQIKLNFADFSLEEGSCIDDYLTVYDGYTSEAVEIGTYCGRKVPRSITSSSDRMLVVFHSNSFITSRGFKFNYQHLTTSSETFKVVEGDEPSEYDPDCSSTITQPGQNVSSPHFGEDEYYLQKRKCRTVIKQPRGRAVKVHFRKFELEESLDCIYDHMNVTFNKKEDKRKTVRLCGYQRMNSLCFFSRGGNVTLEFTSDVMFEGTGYDATYEFVAANETNKDCHYPDSCYDCQDYCYNNGNGYACACSNGKLPPECSQNITWKEPVRTNETYFEGTDIELQCAVNHPHTYTLWDKNFETSGDEVSMLPNERTTNVKVKGSLLKITEAKISDAGNYTCHVQAGATILSRNIKLIIKEVKAVCGLASPLIRNPNLNAARGLVYGENATKAPDIIPWQVHLWDRKKESHHCGGVLISETHVLTAAHCVRGPKVLNFKASDIRVSVGTLNCRQADAFKRSISRYIIHPLYHLDNLAYDFALLELEKPIYNKSKSVYPICLPDSDSWNDIHAGFKGLIAGCGKNPKAKGDTPAVLHMVDVPIANRTKCKDWKFTDDMFCAGDKSEETGDACSGDSGGGFTAQINGRWTLLGLVSFGEGCPGKKHGLYANVSYAMDWIREVAPICGRSSHIEENADAAKISQGTPARLKQFPWVGALWYEGRFRCTVTLVGSTWAVTAKHCLDDYEGNEGSVVLGSLSRSEDKSEATLAVDVDEVRIDFTEKDVALLKFKKKIKGFSDFIQPACLPTKPLVDGQNGTIAGWGKDSLFGNRYPEYLLFAEVTKQSCTTRVDQPTDTCFKATFNSSIRALRGDSGAGIITESQGRNILAAVHSHGNRRDPVGYSVDVLNIVPFIKEEMGWIKEEASCGRAPVFVSEAAETPSKTEVIPWHVYLWNKSKKSHHCGGVLISETHVLTSARCVGGGETGSFRASNIRVSVGTARCTNADALERKVAWYKVHPNFNKKTLAYDFALLELEKPIYEKSKEVYPICLPNSKVWNDVKAGVIAGCGKVSKVLKRVNVPIVDNTQCSGDTSGRDRFCAGNPKAAIGSSCSGYNGGAFAAEVNGSWTLLGLVSFGDDCKGSGFGSYANVSQAMKWINSTAPICGRHHYKPEKKLVSKAHEAVTKQFPWVGSLLDDDEEYVCPVTLISTRYAITSRHCLTLSSVKPFKVLFGSLSWEGNNAIQFEVLNGAGEDVALLKLKNELEGFSPFIQPACLPVKPIRFVESGFIAGWGEINDPVKKLLFAVVRNESRFDPTSVSPQTGPTAVFADVEDRQTLAALYKANGDFTDVYNIVGSIKKKMEWRRDND